MCEYVYMYLFVCICMCLCTHTRLYTSTSLCVYVRFIIFMENLYYFSKVTCEQRDTCTMGWSCIKNRTGEWRSSITGDSVDRRVIRSRQRVPPVPHPWSWAQDWDRTGMGLMREMKRVIQYTREDWKWWLSHTVASLTQPVAPHAHYSVCQWPQQMGWQALGVMSNYEKLNSVAIRVFNLRL